MAVVMTGWLTAQAQGVEAEVPGDHFSLEGALELFKKSSSPEAFERLLNSPDSKVNNLDLNGDGYIDYIRVFDRQDGNVHIFIIQAVVSETESQDIAVIELEKLADGKAVLQIVGDPDIYGIETIIEPTSEVRTYAGTMSTPAIVNVWAWPVVRYVYNPYYVVYHSPWGWRHRPVWWSPWRPIVYVNYYNYWEPYYSHYSFCYTRRIAYAYDFYRPYRTTSVVVVNRYRPKIEHFRNRYSDGHRRRDSRSSSAAIDRDHGSRSSRGASVGDDSRDRNSSGRSSRSGSRSLYGRDNDERTGNPSRTTLTEQNSRSLQRGEAERTYTVPSRSRGAETVTGYRSAPTRRSNSGNRSVENVERREVPSNVRSGGSTNPSRSGSERSVNAPSRQSSPTVRPSRSSGGNRSTVAPSRSSSAPSRQAVRPSRPSAPSRQTASPPSRPSVSPSRPSSPSRSTPKPSRSGGSRSRNN